MSRLRVAMVVSHPIQHYAPMYREIAAAGDVDLGVFFACRWGIEEYRDPDFARSIRWDVPLLDGYEHEFLPIRRAPTQINFRQIDNPAVGEALARFDPGVVAVHGYALKTTLRAIFWGRRNARPVLLVSDSSVSTPVTLWKKPLKRLFVRAIYRRLDGAMTIGDRNRAYHVEHGMPGDRLFPGALPVDAARLRASAGRLAEARTEVRRRFGIRDDAFVALFSGKLAPWKRPIDLAEAVCRIEGQGPGVVALFAGDGSGRSALDAFAARFPERVVVAGFVNQSEIAKLYAASDVLAMPSSKDPHPLVVTEAAALGVPSVVSDRCGCVGPTDVARDGETALVYPCGDVGQLAAAISRLARDRDLRDRLAARASEVAATQDVKPAAKAFAEAAKKLAEMGKR
ncbi:MAG: glycosyltransferase family 4 protein [Thermoanaerobaculia bacterium]